MVDIQTIEEGRNEVSKLGVSDSKIERILQATEQRMDEIISEQDMNLDRDSLVQTTKKSVLEYIVEHKALMDSDVHTDRILSDLEDEEKGRSSLYIIIGAAENTGDMIHLKNSILRDHYRR